MQKRLTEMGIFVGSELQVIRACGCGPLVVAVGPGTELRRPLGITIIGGLFVSQVLTLYTTPVIYLLIDRMRQRRKPKPTPVAVPAE